MEQAEVVRLNLAVFWEWGVCGGGQSVEESDAGVFLGLT